MILRETVQSHSSKEIDAMTTAHNIDLPTVLAERLTTAHPDVLRELLATFIHSLIGAEADALCGAGYGERSSERRQGVSFHPPSTEFWVVRRTRYLEQ